MGYVLQFFSELWVLMGEMAPYLLFGFFMAGLLSVLIRPDFVERHLGRGGLRQTLKATIIGVPMPLCSCGVIPVAASLRRHGAGKGATAAFLASTPQTGVDSIAATWGMMNPLFAFVRVLAAFASGIVSGVLVDWLDCGDEKVVMTFSDDKPQPSKVRHKVLEIFRYGFVALPADIGKSLALGLILAGVLGVVIPDDFFAGKTYGEFATFLIMTVVAVPMYVCSTGSIPVAVAFMRAGISPGAALVFLIAGPATNAATISTLWKVVGKRTVAIYLLSIIAMSWLFGSIFNLLPEMAGGWGVASCHSLAVTPWYTHVAALLLVGVVVNALWPRAGKKKNCCERECNPSVVKYSYQIKGMHCSRCVVVIEKGIQSLKGVQKVSVDLGTGRMTILGTVCDMSDVLAEVRGLGYEIEALVSQE